MAVNGDVSERPSPAKVRGVFLMGLETRRRTDQFMLQSWVLHAGTVAPDRMTLRTVLRDTRSARQIYLTGLPSMKCARLTFAIVSTTNSP